MTQLMDKHDSWLAGFQRTVERELPAATLRPWLADLRQSAKQRFAEVGFPKTSNEEWVNTNVAPIADTTFVPAPVARLTRADIAEYSFAADAAVELVFVNGHYSAELSTAPTLARGVRVEKLNDVLTNSPERLEKRLARQAKIESTPFVALNTAFFRDGVSVHLPRGVSLDLPIHLLFMTAPGSQPTISHPRVLIVAEDTSEASIVETYAGPAGARYFTNTVTEIVVGHGARIEHCKVQQEGDAAFHIGATQVELGRAAYFLSHSASLGSLLTRNDLNVLLTGAGSEAMLNGLSLLAGKQHVDNHTLLDHREPRCPSHELYKAVLDEKAVAVFKGKILVRQAAQKTDSKQSSKTLLLSDNAVMHAQPALEIYADDVKCTHGSTTGPVDEEQIFYLRSRGVGLEAARHLLTYAFLAEVSGRIKVAPVRRRLEAIMAARHGLPRDLRVADLA